MIAQREAVNDFLMYLWNATDDEFLFALFDEVFHDMEPHRQEYVQKFLRAKHSNPASIWSMLDYENQYKLLDAVNARYNRNEDLTAKEAGAAE